MTSFMLNNVGQEVGLKREGEGVSGKMEGRSWKGSGRGRGRDVG